MTKKNILTFILAAAALTAVTSCGDFFKESSQDEIKATTVEDMRAMMYSEAYPYTTVGADSYLRLLTDETECTGLNNQTYTALLQQGQPVFTFSKTMFDGIDPFIDAENTWADCYKKIKGCNAVLDYVNKMTGSENDKEAMKAQCYFLRGMYYLRLALVYCLPYSNTTTTPDPAKALGVPLQLTSEVTDEQKPRTTLSETYAQIEKDLLTSLDMLTKYYPAGTVPFRVTPEAARLLLMRLYFYMGEWQKCVDYATEAINDGPSLLNLNSTLNSYGYPTSWVYDTPSSTEVVFTYGYSSWKDGYFFASDLYQGEQPWVASKTLLAKYDQQNDLRYKCYYDSGFKTIKKNSGAGQNHGDMGLRIAEAYITRAEACLRLYMQNHQAALRTEAINDLNTLRRMRYKNGTNYEVEPAVSDDDEQLLQFTLDERQRELCWENGLRWADIKRLGLSVTHDYIDNEGTHTTYTLEANSPLYALPIPHDAIKRNGHLEQNAR